jgi:hypothetical protein
VGEELRAAGYLYEEETLIFTAISGIAECGPVEIRSVHDADDALGITICDMLLDYGRHDVGNLRDYRTSDWNAYVASGAKSAKQFEARSIYLRFATMNSAIVMRGSPRLSLEKSLYVGTEVPSGARHDALGDAMRKVVRGVKALRAAGVL